MSGLAVATWSIYLGPVITRLMTTNKLIRQISTSLFGLFDGVSFKELWGQTLQLKVFDKDTIKKGVKTAFTFTKDFIVKTFTTAWDLSKKITKKGLEVIRKGISKVMNRIGDIISAPFIELANSN